MNNSIKNYKHSEQDMKERNRLITSILQVAKVSEITTDPNKVRMAEMFIALAGQDIHTLRRIAFELYVG